MFNHATVIEAHQRTLQYEKQLIYRGDSGLGVRVGTSVTKSAHVLITSKNYVE